MTMDLVKDRWENHKMHLEAYDKAIQAAMGEERPLFEYEHPNAFRPPDTEYCWIRYSASRLPTNETIEEGKRNLVDAAEKGWRPVSFKENPHLMTAIKKIYSYGDYIMYAGSVLCQKSTLKQLENIKEFKTFMLPDNSEMKLID